MDWASMVTVGHIVRPHGNRGHVVVVPETDFGEDRFRAGATVHTMKADVVTELSVTAGRFHGGRWIVGFAGFESINDAETLRGMELKVPADSLRELEPNAFYVHDLLGCEVRTVAGETVGIVEKVDLATGVPMLVVTGRGEVLVPFMDAICRTVDLGAKLIEIDPPEGLIELNFRS